MEGYYREQQYIVDDGNQQVQVFEEQVVYDDGTIVQQQEVVITDQYGDEVIIETDVYVEPQPVLAVDIMGGQVFVEQPVIIAQQQIIIGNDGYGDGYVVEEQVIIEQPVFVEEGYIQDQPVFMEQPVFVQETVIIQQPFRQQVVVIETPAVQIFQTPLAQFVQAPFVDVVQTFIQTPFVQVVVQEPFIQVVQTPFVQVVETQNITFVESTPFGDVVVQQRTQVFVDPINNIVLGQQLQTTQIIEDRYGDQIIVQETVDVVYDEQVILDAEIPFISQNVVVQTTIETDEVIIADGNIVQFVETRQQEIIDTPFGQIDIVQTQQQEIVNFGQVQVLRTDEVIIQNGQVIVETSNQVIYTSNDFCDQQVIIERNDVIIQPTDDYVVFEGGRDQIVVIDAPSSALQIIQTSNNVVQVQVFDTGLQINIDRQQNFVEIVDVRDNNFQVDIIENPVTDVIQVDIIDDGDVLQVEIQRNQQVIIQRPGYDIDIVVGQNGRTEVFVEDTYLPVQQQVVILQSDIYVDPVDSIVDFVQQQVVIDEPIVYGNEQVIIDAPFGVEVAIQQPIYGDEVIVQRNYRYGDEVIVQTGFGDQVIIQQPFGGEVEVILEQPFYGGQQVIVDTGYGDQVVIQGPFGEEVLIERTYEQVIVQRPYYGDELIIEQPFYGGEVVIDQPLYNNYNQVYIPAQEIFIPDQVIIQTPILAYEQPYFQQPIIVVSNKQVILDIQENKALNPQFNSFANCKKLYLQPSLLLNQEFFTYKSTNAAVCMDHLHLGNQLIPLSQIDKLKAFPQHTHDRYYKIKLSHFGGSKFIAADMKANQSDLTLPNHYRWFSNLIVARLRHRGVPIPQVVKNDENVQLTQKMNNTLVGGHIFKRSKYIKKWQQRYTILTPQGLFSYKNVNEPYTYSIKASSIEYVWTRFDFLQPNVMIIKIMHSSHEKTQFGIPLMNFTQNQRHNWLYQFYRLMMEGKGISTNC